MQFADRRPALLQALSNGQWRTEKQLCAELGLSCAELCSCVRALSEWAVDIDSGEGCCYRLRHAFVPLDASRITAELASIGDCVPPPIDLYPVLDSTNEQLLRERGSTAKVCLTEHQTDGRGRLGRHWISPFGTNLYLSLKWHFDPAPTAMSALSLAVGVAVARALRDWELSSVELKWPNDVLMDGRKLAGILIEQRGARPGAGATVVIGIGLNVAMSQAQAAAVDQPWIGVHEALGRSAPIDRNALAARILANLISALQTFAAQGLEPFRADWARLDALHGRWVRAQATQETFDAQVEGIDDDGRLLLRRRDGSTVKLLSGEVQVRPLRSR